MKARDIIPGWPRGKSTSFPTLPTVWLPLHPTICENIDESRCNALYHWLQQEMVDRDRRLEAEWRYVLSGLLR